MTDKPWLKLAEVVGLLHEAGYTDHPATVRRDVDAGRYGEEGTDWYRTDGGHRLVTPAAVRAVIARRRQPRSGDLE